MVKSQLRYSGPTKSSSQHSPRVRPHQSSDEAEPNNRKFVNCYMGLVGVKRTEGLPERCLQFAPSLRPMDDDDDEKERQKEDTVETEIEICSGKKDKN